MDAALLAGAHADGLAALHIADRVGLGVLQHDQAHHQVALLVLGQRLVFGYDVAQHCVGVDQQVLAALLEGHAEHGAAVQLVGHIAGVDGNDRVIALLLGFQHGQCLIGVAGGDDAVGHFLFDQQRSGQVAHVRQGNPVAKAGHPVGAAGAGIGAGQGRQLHIQVDVVHPAQRLVQGQSDGGTRGGDMLEAGRSGQPQRGFQVMHQLVAVEGVQKVDIAGAAVQNLDGQVAAVRHIDAGGFLVGVHAIFQLKFFHR